MSVACQTRGLLWAASVAAALALAGCSSSIADWPGAPSDASARPKDAGGYLPVHDLPPDRDEATMPPAERAKIEAELIAARDRQAAASAKDTAAGPSPK